MTSVCGPAYDFDTWWTSVILKSVSSLSSVLSTAFSSGDVDTFQPRCSQAGHSDTVWASSNLRGACTMCRFCRLWSYVNGGRIKQLIRKLCIMSVKYLVMWATVFPLLVGFSFWWYCEIGIKSSDVSGRKLCIFWETAQCILTIIQCVYCALLIRIIFVNIVLKIKDQKDGY